MLKHIASLSLLMGSTILTAMAAHAQPYKAIIIVSPQGETA